MATPRVLPLIGGLVATLAIGVVGPWISLAGIRGRLSFGTERCHLGDRVHWTAIIARFGRRPSYIPRVAWRTAAASTFGIDTLIPIRRGRFPPNGATPTIESDWPFGIVSARKPLAVDRTLIVRPVTTAVRFPVGVVTARRPGRDASVGLPGSAGDVLSLRDYRVGDSIRSIHWPQTARQGDVVVCERPGHAAPRVRIMLQGGDPRHEVPEASLDAGVTIASSLVESWAAHGADIEVCWTSAPDECVRHFPKDRRALDETLDALACIEAVSTTRPSGMRQVDLEVLILVDGDAHAILPQEHRMASSRVCARPTRRLVVTFDHEAIPDTVRVPASSSAAAVLDKALGEMGHDPDTTR
jgi:uncharacterized protein (DUF58 family)